MTPSFQTSFLSSASTSNSGNHRRSNRYSESIYQVEITDFNDEVQTLEVCAGSFAEAAEIAKSICLCDVYMMNIYEFC